MFAVLAATLLVAADAPPSIERATKLLAPAVVAVVDQRGTRPGFFVSGSGVVVAVVGDGVDHVVVELPSGERRRAHVAIRDDDGLALAVVKRIEKDDTFPSLGLGQGRPPAPTTWLLGVGFVDGRAAPSVGGVRKVDAGRWLLDLPLDPGAPIVVDDRVIAVVVERKGTTACVAVPVERVLSLVKRMP